MRSGALILLGLAAAVVLGWLFLGESGPQRIDDVGIEGAGLDDGGMGIGGADDGRAAGTNGTRGTGGGLSPDGDRQAIRARASRAEGVGGRVVSADGEPVMGATVSLFERRGAGRVGLGRPDGKALASTQTDEDGEFRVGPAPDQTPLRVRAQAAGYAPAIADVPVRGGYAEIVLDRGGSLRVHIVDRSGEPVHQAQAVHFADEVVTTVRADEQGVARFAALPAGSATLVIIASGYRSVRDPQLSILTDEETERTVVLAPAEAIEGTVVDAETDRPITDAQVTLHYPTLPTLTPEASVTTDHEGRFRITNHAGERERMQYRVLKAGYAEARRTRSGSDTSAIQVKLHRMVDAFRGVVYDTNRIPVGGVRVTYGRIGGISEGEDPPETRTDQTGNFRLPPPPWVTRGSGYQVIAMSEDGELGHRYVAVPAKPEMETKRIEIFLVGSGQLNGRVFTPDGKPVASAVVELEPDWSQRVGTGLHWQVFEAVRDRRLLALDTVTDEDGNYLFLRVPAIAYRVNASRGGERGTSRETVTITPGEMSQMDITLGSGSAIEGWVHDDRDEPVAGAQVRAIPIGRPGRGRPTLATTRTRSDGTFQLRGVGDGTFQIAASMVGYGSAVAKDVTAGQTGVALVLPQRGRLLGLVVQDGRPFGGTFSAEARIDAQAGGQMGARVGGRAWSGGQSARTFRAEDGHFALSGLAAGTYRVHVSTSDGMVGASDAIAVVEGRDTARARVEISAGAVLRGRVIDHTGGSMTGAWVQIWPRTNAQDNGAATTGRVRADKSGDYEIKGLGPGAYNVTVWANGRNWSVDVELEQGANRVLDLVYEQPGTIEVTVHDDEARPIADAQPELVSKSGVRVHVNYQASKRDGLIQDPQDWARMQRTDGHGRVVRHHVPPGRYKVTARHKDFVGTSEEVWVDVRAGGRSQARVMLRPKKDEDR